MNSLAFLTVIIPICLKYEKNILDEYAHLFTELPAKKSTTKIEPLDILENQNDLLISSEIIISSEKPQTLPAVSPITIKAADSTYSPQTDFMSPVLNENPNSTEGNAGWFSTPTNSNSILPVIETRSNNGEPVVQYCNDMFYPYLSLSDIGMAMKYHGKKF